MVYGLIYISKVGPEVTPIHVEQILASSRANNPANEITGVLLLKSGIFVQYLEGRRVQVRELYKTILRDRRHTDVKLIKEQRTRERLFPNWSMAYCNIDEVSLPWFNSILKLGTEESKILRDPLEQLIESYRT